MVLVKFDSIHDRTEKFTYVAVNVEVLSSVTEIGLCKRQKVLKVWNQSWISVRIFEAQFGLALKFSEAAEFGFFWIDNAIPAKPFAINPKCVVWPQYIGCHMKLLFRVSTQRL